ncbi:hypothetical protein A3Q56_00650 [Intoshia linei]|uniref:Transforming acidic coiled-coil-containing protein C-terminal domain-containing protein n=1 Tax=Intoshia linei TaxID=1819745 RepID=A0A177BD29_9BILA|nr:hypothetical protein A3Q56_00650 [Intoshia linei]
MKNSYMEPENLINFDDSVNYTQKENENYQKLQNETFSPKEVNDTSGKWKNLCVQKKNANMPRQSILTRFDPMYVDENKTETSSSIKDGSANTSSIIDRYSSLDLEASKLDNSINDLTQQEKIPNIVENQYTTFELNNTRQISNESDYLAMFNIPYTSISSKNGSSGVMITPVLKYSENDFNNLKKKLKCDFEKEKEIIDQEWLAKIKISKKKLSEVSGKAKSNQKQSNELQKMVNEFEQISTELSEKFNKCQHQHDRLIKERERIVKSLLTGQDYLKMLNERCIKLRENINCTQKEAQEKFDLISIQHENMINLYNRKNDELSQLFNLKIKYENDCQQNTIKSNIENARFEAILKKHDIELQSLKITINQKMQKLNSLNSLCEDVLNSRSR